MTSRTSSSIDLAEASEIFGALAHRNRLEIFRLLVRYLPYGLAAGDIGRLLALQHNTLSAHLSTLERVGLLCSRREGRSIIFAAVEARAADVAAFLTDELPIDFDQRNARGGRLHPFPARRETAPAKKPINVLVICTGNSARSIFAEAILNREGAGRIRSFSAGSQPKPRPHPAAITFLGALGYDTDSFRSKSWNEFADAQSPIMDFIFTVCDVAASEPCPAWPGRPMTVHWGISDPIIVGNSEAEKRAALLDAYRRLTHRVTSFVNLDFENLDRAALRRKLVEIGAMEGATEMSLHRSRA
jgi:arsenate reductase